MNLDLSDLGRAAREAEKKGAHFESLWRTWLVMGPATGLGLLLAFARAAECTDKTLMVFAPAYVAFTLAMISAAVSMLCTSKEKIAFSEHLAHALNQNERAKTLARIPEVFASPKRLADEANRTRNFILEKLTAEIHLSETAWKRVVRWRWAKRILATGSIVAFVIGVACPISTIMQGGTLSPRDCTIHVERTR